MGNSVYITMEPVMTPELRALGNPDLHTTLCYFPDAASAPCLVDGLRDWAQSVSRSGAVEATTDGVALFSTPKGRLMVLLVRSRGLDELRLGAREVVQGSGVLDGEGMGLGAAHMTLWPVPDDQDMLHLPDLLLPKVVTFDRLTFHAGNEVLELPMIQGP